jgi:rSAM-associated Gly-rich repeat protein
LNITTRTGLLGFLLVLSALSVPVANATTNQPTSKASPSIEGRLNRIAVAIRQRETQLQDTQQPISEMFMVRGFADGGRGGAFANGGGGFANAHPTYGGGGAFANGGGGAGFANGAYGGAGFVNGAYGGGGFVNGSSGGAGFANGVNGGAGFRNW